MGCQNSSGACAIAHLLHHLARGTMRAPARVALVRNDFLPDETLDPRCDGLSLLQIEIMSHRLQPASCSALCCRPVLSCLPSRLPLPSPAPWDWYAVSTHRSPADWRPS